nr:uncharacterized protein LOC113803507 isoform X1 [Penaeus vannamei]XP_027210093.1 uncharacterized protein LOC113803507 isoform X1 [Penaeus vannamei]XP_027210094.1 uncharacterized protein LOC113803507 isoform X1 [Penaeus vannamei]XP_027210095.1 uncharacterized protein LOC113803507 isoform X2 [Penaeus vannamei]
MGTHILVLLLTAKLVASTKLSLFLLFHKVCSEWASTIDDLADEVSQSKWEKIYILFVSEENDTTFNIRFSSSQSVDLNIPEAYVYYVGEVYHEGAVFGDCAQISPVCNTYFHFWDKNHLVGEFVTNSFSISSQSPLYYLACGSLLQRFPPAPLRRRNLSLPGVEPTEPQASRPSVEPTEPQPNVSLPGPGPKQPKDQDHQCAAHTIGLGIVGAALVFLLTFVCVAGWRARRAAESPKLGAAKGHSTASGHESENSIYGMMEMGQTNT